MRLTIDTEARRLIRETDDVRDEFPLDSPEAFALLSEQWVAVGWGQKYSYNFTWLGRPLIQLPEDVLRIQEVVFTVEPSVIVETGVAHGGSLVFYASLCRALGRGRVIGVDIEIRPHNRTAIEAHCLAELITLVEGDSVAPTILESVRSEIRPDDRVLVILDSNHSKAHVLSELNAYAPLVSVGSYIVVADGVMALLTAVPGGRPEWDRDNPQEAVREFLGTNDDFELEEPTPLFSESPLSTAVTYWPSGYLRRTR